MVKVARNAVEEGKVALRNVRRDAHKDLRELRVGEDDHDDELPRATISSRS